MCVAVSPVGGHASSRPHSVHADRVAHGVQNSQGQLLLKLGTIPKAGANDSAAIKCTGIWGDPGCPQQVRPWFHSQQMHTPLNAIPEASKFLPANMSRHMTAQAHGLSVTEQCEGVDGHSGRGGDRAGTTSMSFELQPMQGDIDASPSKVAVLALAPRALPLVRPNFCPPRQLMLPAQNATCMHEILKQLKLAAERDDNGRGCELSAYR